jgi:hypothetical protein
MFYTMKLEFQFLTATLILVGAVIAIALPTPVQAVSAHLWCYDNPQGTVCPKDTHGDCNKAQKLDVSALTKCYDALS